MSKDKCEHDFLGILHCRKCGEQYHTDWVDALVDAKLEAVENVFHRLKTTIELRGPDRLVKSEAIKLVTKALAEVERVYKETKNDGRIYNMHTTDGEKFVRSSNQ